MKTSLCSRLLKCIAKVLGYSVGLLKGIFWKKTTAKQLLSPLQKAECTGAVAFACEERRGICSAEAGPGVYIRKVDVPNNGHKVCGAT